MSDQSRQDGQQQRGVFEVDERRALDALRLEWGDAYDIGFEAGAWIAYSRDAGRRVISGETPDELTMRLRADWGTS